MWRFAQQPEYEDGTSLPRHAQLFTAFYSFGTHALKRFVYGGIMESMREAWTDERLDDLNDRVGELSRRMDEGFREVREEISGLHRLILQVGGGIIAAQMAGFLGLAAALS